MITLDKLKINGKAIVRKVKGDEALKRRFLDLGIIPGEVLECVLISPFKDPKAYLINGNILALRNIDAKKIEVDYE